MPDKAPQKSRGTKAQKSLKEKRSDKQDKRRTKRLAADH
jgi:hypothetical protein